ncbi:MAG: SAM-dependent methyltransferase [Deltaproteobacteria bacterium]|nr:SAM-dependent methyltransferase [Deltaproteobacteria bacterium]
MTDAADPTDPATRAGWAAAFTARAEAHWTPSRVAALAAGKALVLPPIEAALLLRALGLLRADASLPPSEVRKYWQVSHMVTVLGPALRALREREGTLRVVDAGCGRSYLTLVLAWIARARWGQRLEVLGVDRNPDVIAAGRRRAAIAGLDDLVRFAIAPLDGFDLAAAWSHAFVRDPDVSSGPRLDAVVALHACDTATCDAIALGAHAGAALIAVAPCCQAELARGWAELADAGAAGAFAPIWAAPHLRRETAAEVTDALRTLLLRAAGYEVAAIEFVPSPHTRKNTLVRAVRRGPPDPAARAAYDALVAATGGRGLALADRMPPRW